MSENLIESVEPLLAPPVTRRPTGITESDGDGVDVAFMLCSVDEEADA
jgi:hypothetical protein